MKDWAIEKGATLHALVSADDGRYGGKARQLYLSDRRGRSHHGIPGKELVRGEPDASSFPSGRSARDLRGARLHRVGRDVVCVHQGRRACIPTAFCSYGGEALDKKTPLLRSMEALNRQAMRILRLFGNETVTNVKTTVGPSRNIFIRRICSTSAAISFTPDALSSRAQPEGQGV